MKSALRFSGPLQMFLDRSIAKILKSSHDAPEMKMKNKRYFLVSAVLVAGLASLVYWEEIRSAFSGWSSADRAKSGLALVGQADEFESSHLEKGIKSEKSQAAYVLGKSTQSPSGNAMEIISALRPLAESGDRKSALLLYLKLSSCHSALTSVPDQSEVEAYRKAGADNDLLKNAAQALEECDGVSDELLAERGVWLEAAANAGLVEAQILYAIDSSAILGNESEMLRDPEKVQRYKSSAMRFLNDAASGGNVDALMRLGNAYDKGVITRQDSVRAYAYLRAAQLVKPDVVPSGLVSTFQSGVPNSQISRANEIAQSIAKACCGR